MIIVVDSPQNSSYEISYSITNDILTITLNGKTEQFDFTDLPEGEVEGWGIEPEIIEFCPIERVFKIGGEVTVVLQRFYRDDESEVFENGDYKMEIPFGFFG